MNTFLKISIPAVLLLLATVPCFALRSIRMISPDEAKQWGIEIRATPAGPEAVWLELEFKTDGKFKDHSHVELEIREGEKTLLAYATLSEKRTSSGNAVVRFMASRAYLAKFTLSVVTGFPSAYVNNELRVGEFIDLKKLH